MSVVFDTNVLLSSTLWDGSVAQKLLFKLIRSSIKISSFYDKHLLNLKEFKGIRIITPEEALRVI